MNYMQSLQQKTKDQFVNELYNKRVAQLADYTREEYTIDRHCYSKRIPYIGWSWRTTDFVGKRVSIGDCDGFIGVMENNKWDYSKRKMTEQEVDTFIEYLERAFAENGTTSEGIAKAEIVFNELWDWFQALRDTGDWA